jgi:hypothetical protein
MRRRISEFDGGKDHTDCRKDYNVRPWRVTPMIVDVSENVTMDTGSIPVTSIRLSKVSQLLAEHWPGRGQGPEIVRRVGQSIHGIMTERIGKALQKLSTRVRILLMP